MTCKEVGLYLVRWKCRAVSLLRNFTMCRSARVETGQPEGWTVTAISSLPLSAHPPACLLCDSRLECFFFARWHVLEWRALEELLLLILCALQAATHSAPLQQLTALRQRAPVRLFLCAVYPLAFGNFTGDLALL